MSPVIHVTPEVRDALAIGRGVVALETSVVAHGLPPPVNMEAAQRMAAAVRESGAVPAFIAVIGGRVVVGAGEQELEHLANPATQASKAGVRDLAALMNARKDAGTTVSATVAIAARLGIRLFATGGLGGVHRKAASDEGAALDVSSDLVELSRRPVCVVAAGPKVILDVPATAELLETLRIPVLGFRTSEFPAFYVAETGMRLEHRVDDPAAMADLLRIHWQVLERREGVLLCVAPPQSLPAAEVESALAVAQAEARTKKLTGKMLSPFLLQSLDRATAGGVRAANVALLERNAQVAGQVAVAWAGR